MIGVKVELSRLGTVYSTVQLYFPVRYLKAQFSKCSKAERRSNYEDHTKLSSTRLFYRNIKKASHRQPLRTKRIVFRL